MSHETDALKRDLERLRLEFDLARRDHDRIRDAFAQRINELEAKTATGTIVDGTISVPALEQRLATIEEAMPSSTAQLLALASTRMTGLLGVLAHDEATTVRKLEAVTEKLSHRTIYTNGDPYLTRWYLWPEGPRTVEDADLERRENDATSDLPFAMFIHRFHRGDADRDQHNHPWDLSVAVVLAGGYREERDDETRVMLPGTVNVIRGDDFHRVDLLNPTIGSWSLFVAGRKTGDWGFRDKITGVVTSWQTYIASKAMKHTPVDPTGHHAEDDGTNYG